MCANGGKWVGSGMAGYECCVVATQDESFGCRDLHSAGLPSESLVDRRNDNSVEDFGFYSY
jgi:hypothetical protein